MSCFVASGLAQRESFQFTDSQGRCWVCHPGAPCSPCSSEIINPLLTPPPHDVECPIPDCSVVTNRQFLFPSQSDPTSFYQCRDEGAAWVPVLMACQCETFFDYLNQRFVYIGQFIQKYLTIFSQQLRVSLGLVTILQSHADSDS